MLHHNPYIATWRNVVFVAFVIDVFARRIVGWRVLNSLKTDFPHAEGQASAAVARLIKDSDELVISRATST